MCIRDSNKYLNQLRKLNKLKMFKVSNSGSYYNNRQCGHNNKFSNHIFYQRFMNLTNVTFNSFETKLIEKGFKYNIQRSNYEKEFEILGVDCELACNKYNKFHETSESIPLNKYIVADKLTSLYAKQIKTLPFNLSLIHIYIISFFSSFCLI